MAGPSAVTRVLVRPPNWLGDAVLALPALAAVRAHFPAAQLTVAAVPAVASMFREDTDAAPDRVLDLPSGAQAAVAAIEAERADCGILFPNSFGSAWQLWRAGVPARWGFGTAGRRWLLTRRSPRARGEMHQADYYRVLVRGLGMTCGDELPRLAPRRETLERARVALEKSNVDPARPLVGFAPGAAYGQAKQWPPDRMAGVMARLAREDGVTCVIVGAGHDRDAARAIESWLRTHAPDALPRIIDLTGRTSLGVLVGVLRLTRVFVSNDSGAMHVAAALGRPVVAIFGPTNERRTRPLGDHDVLTERVFCRPCMLRDCPIDHRCMKRISVDRVCAAVRARLAVEAAA